MTCIRRVDDSRSGSPKCESVAWLNGNLLGHPDPYGGWRCAAGRKRAISVLHLVGIEGRLPSSHCKTTRAAHSCVCGRYGNSSTTGLALRAVLNASTQHRLTGQVRLRPRAAPSAAFRADRRASSALDAEPSHTPFQTA